jgi:phospholipid-transporting ATPase
LTLTLFLFQVNLRRVLILNGNEICNLTLESLQVGQIVKVLRDELIPADLVLLKSSETDGLCYLETSAIDGESNLKLRQAHAKTHRFENVSIVCDLPNNEIYNFQGSLQLNPSEILPLDRNQFLPRGSVLVNTDWIIGVIVYTGIETKIMQNAKGTLRRKSTKMDKLNDIQTAQIVVILFILVFILFFGHVYYNRFILPYHAYLRLEEPKDHFAFLWKYFANFVTFLLLLNNLVPISLSVTLEVVRAMLSHLINNDLDIYDSELQIPSKAQNSNVLDELGRIEYIMTDKTGTLTCNQMELKHLFINGKVFRNCLDTNEFLMKMLKSDSPSRIAVDKFIEMMALCHTVMIDKRTGTYQASSPDELALVKSVKQLGCSFVSRTFDKIEIQNGDLNDSRTKFTLKAVIEFSSDRKRMSVVLENDHNKKIYIYTKGAESTIFPRCEQSEMLSGATKVVEEFSIEGLRTLCFAFREIHPEEFPLWFSQWTEALNTFGPNRQELLDSAAAAIETDLQLIGVSGIEDRLQDGVSGAISSLLKANIKIWILTGDRAETATNTAYLCGLLKPNHTLIPLFKPEDLYSVLSQTPNPNLTQNGYVLIISGELFALILADPVLRRDFVSLAAKSRSLIACRLSPLQKTEITKLVQVELGKTTLAIGDGGNDVGMIQAADVGIGINGLEGTQAARSADFSIAKFRFIVKLLLVHGSWSFHRISRVILYTMYKNFILVLCQFFFAFGNAFSAQSAFGSLFLLLYNSLFSVCPPVIIGLTDQYVTAPELIKHPQLYQFGQKGKFYNTKAFWECIVNAAVQSFAVSVCFHYFIKGDPVGIDGKPANLAIYGDIFYLIILITISIKVLLFTNYFTRFMSLALLTALIACFSILWIKTSGTILTSFLFYSASILIPIATLLKDFLWKFYCRQFRPRAYHIVQEMRAVESRRNKREAKQKQKTKLKISKTFSFENETSPLNKNKF